VSDKVLRNCARKAMYCVGNREVPHMKTPSDDMRDASYRIFSNLIRALLTVSEG